MKAVLLSVGDELIVGQTVDTNSSWLSMQLVAHGCMPLYHKTVGDDVDGIAEAIREAGNKADLIIITGGLGPTQDDMTRHALAKVVNRPLILDEPSLKSIEAYFRSLDRELPATNRIQAMHPDGTEVLANPWGTAPGIHALMGRAHLYAFPGVPHEMRRMMDRYVVPHLERLSGRGIVTESITTFGAGESSVAEALGPLMDRTRNPLVGTTVSGGEVIIRVRADLSSRAESIQACEKIVGEINERLGNWVVGTGGVTLEEATIKLARHLRITLAVAESCTGGLLGKLLTDIPGASDVFIEGWVTYSNDSKCKELGVDPGMLARSGAVSEEVARAMVEGALTRSGADVALSVTGIAGPDGGTGVKPVGTVWLGIAVRNADGIHVDSQYCRFPGQRDLIRIRAAKAAINLLRLALLQMRK